MIANLTSEYIGKAEDIPWRFLADEIEGSLHVDQLTRRLYATDASIYEEMPKAVVFPKHTEDCISIVQFAKEHHLPLIPRGAGTSLAGQCVGNGMVIDVSRHMNSVQDINANQLQVTVEPGTILCDLNGQLSATHLTMPIDPSTANRCTIGGMIGNNAWGAHTPKYGTTRDAVKKLQVVLSDGSTTNLQALTPQELEEKKLQSDLEGKVYRTVVSLIDRYRDIIIQRSSGSDVLRNNAGYALDKLALGQPWEPDGEPFNLATLACGSEGTLMLTTAATLQLSVIPAHHVLVCAHFDDLMKALQAVPVIAKQSVAAIELLDDRLLQVSHNHPDQMDNRFWLQGNPAAVLIIEIQANDADDLDTKERRLTEILGKKTTAYAFTVVDAKKIEQVWALRRASLGMLMGNPNKEKTVTMIEDCAVPINKLPAFASAIKTLMQDAKIPCVFYGPVSVGAIHLRPEFDLELTESKQIFSSIMDEVTKIIVQLNGTMTSKHGDGRVRSEKTAVVLGQEFSKILKEIKLCFDPDSIFNPGKIVAPVRSDSNWRSHSRSGENPLRTIFKWHDEESLLGAAKKCNGAGVCLKKTGSGTMCPSYMATRQEQHSTRGRANLLRQIINSKSLPDTTDMTQLKQVLASCLACKGCKKECPAGVDMARLKAEVMHFDMATNGIPWKTRLLANFEKTSHILARFPTAANLLIRSGLINAMVGFDSRQKLPLIANQTFQDWVRQHQPHTNAGTQGELVLLNDPYTNYYEPRVGIATVELLEMAGYKVQVTPPLSSGRMKISLGLLPQARQTLESTIRYLQRVNDKTLPVIGMEPSEILTFRDEALDLVSDPCLFEHTKYLSDNTLLLDEFICREYESHKFKLPSGKTSPQAFLIHGHCHQKALASMQSTEQALAIIPDSTVSVIPSGCCGMAGTFGYEKSQYDLSRQIGEMTLLPAVREANPDVIIVATGASCRQQIAKGTKQRAYHPAEILRLSQKASG